MYVGARPYRTGSTGYSNAATCRCALSANMVIGDVLWTAKAWGWVHYSLLSGNRTVIIDRDLLVLRRQPDANGVEIAILEIGVIANLDKCYIDWCRLHSAGYRGWALKAGIFGVDENELRD